MNYPKNQSGFAHAWVMIIVVIAVAVGVGYYVVKNNDSKPLGSQQSAGSTELIDQLPGNLLTVEKIQNLVNDDKPGTRIASIRLEKDGELLVYVVHLADGTKLVYNAQSGLKVAGAKVEAKDDDDDDLPKDITVGIDFNEAYQIALAQNPGGQLKEAELDDEDGQTVYKFQFSDGTEIKISAKDGSIVKLEKKNKEGKKEDQDTGEDESDDSGRSGHDSDEDGVEDREDHNDDNDGQNDSKDSDDDNDGTEDDEDDDDGQDEDGDGQDEDEDNSGSGDNEDNEDNEDNSQN